MTYGKKIGITRAGIEKGDKVCLIIGIMVFFVLRKDGEGTAYNFIDEAYCQAS